jgi:hypothetical protein
LKQMPLDSGAIWRLPVQNAPTGRLAIRQRIQRFAGHERRKMGYPQNQGLYDSRNEHDACGVGFVAQYQGAKSHETVKRGLANPFESGPSRRGGR